MALLFSACIAADDHNRAHTNRKSMHCDCGETFTRVIDLDAHVGLVHIESELGKDLSVRAVAGAEVLEGHDLKAHVAYVFPPKD